MRPSKLTIYGINSYVTEQTVDFKKLSEGNLFGIFGATGSGKSTILDSIIIALYGNSDRDNLSNIINLNLKEAYIKFEFELDRNNEVNTYEVTRNYKLRPSGLNSTAYLINKTTNEVLGDSTDIVNGKIEEMLGISKREFLKCVALPQNEFDKFLLDTPSERKKSIAKLFNIENFGDSLNRKVKSRLDILNTKNAQLEKQLEMFGEITEENQRQLDKDILTDEREVAKLTRIIERLSEEVKQLDELNVKLNNFIDAKNTLSDIKSQEDYYNKLQSSLEVFEKNKTNLDNAEALKNKIVELDSFQEKLKSLKIELDLNKKKFSMFEKDYLKTKSDKELQMINLNVFKINIEKKKFIIKELDNIDASIKTLKDRHSQKLDELLNITERENKVSKNIDRTLADLENVKNELRSIDAVMKQLVEIRVLGESQEYVTKLKELKRNVDLTSLDEVKYYPIYKQVDNLLGNINSLVLSGNAKLRKRKHLLESLEVTEDTIDTLNRKMLKRQNTLLNDLNMLNKKYADLYSILTGYNNDSAKIQSDISQLKNDILEKNNNKKAYQQQLAELDGIEDTSQLIDSLEAKMQDLEDAKFDINNSINNNLSDIKATEIEIKYLSDSIDELKALVPDGFNPLEYISEINDENYEEKKTEVDEYLKKKTYTETLVNSLSEELKDVDINSEEILNKHKELDTYVDNLNEAKVRLGINKSTKENNIKMLLKQNEVETELHQVHNDLKLTQKLASYIARNALVDYVSEEYLYLITQYANKFVYSISRGKYMLKYSNENSGEFLAIDNFNGGMTRSIKTLSGGERFIFSLSLALGVSQSIAVNNNKSFNFFFIDEGFGNLSDDYIEDVLECFDSLIKLDFTVGFITHVEKMEEYIINKVVVTKENNEEGSIIQQY
ncbi:MAG: SMC family ATPase [Eubacteriales bacterium]|nr:SMC family ATPase [Eubacteriales bacterium]